MIQITQNVCVVQTYWVGRPGTHWQIHLASEADPRTPHPRTCRCLVTVTQDEELFTRVEAAEGETTRFDVRWRTAHRLDGRSCQVLEVLVEQGAQGSRRSSAHNRCSPACGLVMSMLNREGTELTVAV